MGAMGPDRFWCRRPVLVTGATGFLGGWLIESLVEQEAEVVALVRDGAPASRFAREGWDSRVVTVRGGLGDRALLRRVMCEYEVDTVFHLAAQTLVGVGKSDPVGTLEANVQGTWNVLDAARESGVKQIVVASSDKAYGASADLPYLETHRLEGRYPYDASKSCADLVCSMYATTFGLPVCVTRCGNLFGGGDLNYSRLIPGVIRATLLGERFLIRSDGTFMRDFLYVEDAVSGYRMIAEALAADRSLAGEAFNLSLGQPQSVLEMVRKVLGKMDRLDLDPMIQNNVTSEIRGQYVNADKARRRLGWVPRHGLEAGLDKTIGWYRDFHASGASRLSLGVASA